MQNITATLIEDNAPYRPPCSGGLTPLNVSNIPEV